MNHTFIYPALITASLLLTVCGCFCSKPYLCTTNAFTTVPLPVYHKTEACLTLPLLFYTVVGWLYPSVHTEDVLSRELLPVFRDSDIECSHCENFYHSISTLLPPFKSTLNLFHPDFHCTQLQMSKKVNSSAENEVSCLDSDRKGRFLILREAKCQDEYSVTPAGWFHQSFFYLSSVTAHVKTIIVLCLCNSFAICHCHVFSDNCL